MAKYTTEAASVTALELDLLRAGIIGLDTMIYDVETPAGTWWVWRDTGDDEHERCYRSPDGQYYLGTTHEDIVEPWLDEQPWMGCRVRVNLMYLTELESRDPKWSWKAEATEPKEYLRWAAAAWFLQPEGPWHDETDWPEDIADRIRLMKSWEDEEG